MKSLPGKLSNHSSLTHSSQTQMLSTHPLFLFTPTSCSWSWAGPTSPAAKTSARAPRRRCSSLPSASPPERSQRNPDTPLSQRSRRTPTPPPSAHSAAPGSTRPRTGSLPTPQEPWPNLSPCRRRLRRRWAPLTAAFGARKRVGGRATRTAPDTARLGYPPKRRPPSRRVYSSPTRGSRTGSCRSPPPPRQRMSWSRAPREPRSSPWTPTRGGCLCLATSRGSTWRQGFGSLRRGCRDLPCSSRWFATMKRRRKGYEMMRWSLMIGRSRWVWSVAWRWMCRTRINGGWCYPWGGYLCGTLTQVAASEPKLTCGWGHEKRVWKGLERSMLRGGGRRGESKMGWE